MNFIQFEGPGGEQYSVCAEDIKFIRREEDKQGYGGYPNYGVPPPQSSSPAAKKKIVTEICLGEGDDLFVEDPTGTIFRGLNDALNQLKRGY